MSYFNVQVLLFYYDRPKMVQKYALSSVCRSSLSNWEISFIDDSTNQDGPAVVEQFFHNNPHYAKYKDKVKIYQTNDSIENKTKRGNSIFGKFANQAMKESEAEISIMLCDDDALLPDYTLNLSCYYGAGDPSRIYSYSQLWGFDPSANEDFSDIKFGDFYLNRRDAVLPMNQLDSSQVSWVRARALQDDIQFPYPQTHNLDADIYGKMGFKWGPCPWNGFYGQYKGWFPGQLGKRGAVWNIDTER